MIAEDVKAKNFEQPEPVNVEEAFETGEETNVPYIRNRILRLTVLILLSILSLYGLVLFVGYFIQHIFVFDPQRSHTLKHPSSEIFGALIKTPSEKSNGSKGWRVIELKTPDNVTLHNYWIHANDELRQRDGRVPDTILYLHGKDGRIDRRTTMISEIYTKHYCNIFMLSYRGYGKSTGSPSEAGLKTDAQTALDWILRNVSEEERKKIYVYGQSMGAAVSINLVSRNNDKVRGLIIENTFLSIPRLMPDLSVLLYTFIPIMNQIFDSASDIQRITTPILFLSGSADKFIPPAHMIELHEIARRTNPRCTFVTFQNGGHADTSRMPGYFESILRFITNTCEV